MAEHEQDDQQPGPSFHWPPTTEELDSIHVIEMPRRAPKLARPWWQRSFSESVMAQAAVLAGSLAAIGIALMSLITPAQPPRASKASKPAPLSAYAIAPTTVPLAAAVASTPIAGGMIDDELPASNGQLASLADGHSLPARATSPSESGRERLAFATGSPAVDGRFAPSQAAGLAGGEAHARLTARATTVRTGREVAYRTSAPRARVVSRDERLARREQAGADPVSRFAVATGRSMWKGLQQFGRSFKRDTGDNWASRPMARPGGGRRMAAAADLGDDGVPSER